MSTSCFQPEVRALPVVRRSTAVRAAAAYAVEPESRVHDAAGAGTADEFIEAEVRTLLMAKDPPLVYVATSDRVSGDVSFGSGAVMINSDQFIRNIIKTDEEVGARGSSSSLAHSLT